MIIPLRFGAIKKLNPKISLILLPKMFKFTQISNLESFFIKVRVFFIRFNLISMNRLFGVGQSLQKEKQ